MEKKLKYKVKFLIAILCFILFSSFFINSVFSDTVDINASVPAAEEEEEEEEEEEVPGGGPGPINIVPSPECTPGFVECGEWSECVSDQQSRECSNGCLHYDELRDCQCNVGDIKRCGVTDVGACQFGSHDCQDFFWRECIGLIEPVDEVCFDNLDNDCNGEIDEDCYECQLEGVSRQCGLTDVGVCQFGEEVCQSGFWSGCVGAVFPQDEICGDDLDNDCDTQIDEGCLCLPDWQCGGWLECLEGLSYRSCIDFNNCGDDTTMPDYIKSCLVECDLTCGNCQKLDLDNCYCIDIYPCCGNNLCEAEENNRNCPADCPLIPPPPVFECSDNIDNDHDGLVDYPQDPGCRDSLDDSEVDIKERVKAKDISGVIEEVVDAIQKSIVENKYLSRVGQKIVLVSDSLVIENIACKYLVPALFIFLVLVLSIGLVLKNKKLKKILNYILIIAFILLFLSILVNPSNCTLIPLLLLLILIIIAKIIKFVIRLFYRNEKERSK